MPLSSTTASRLGGAVHALAGTWTPGRLLRSHRRTRPVRARTGPSSLAPLPALGLPQRGARSRAAPGRHGPPGGPGARGPADALRRVYPPGRTPQPGSGDHAAGCARPDAALQARRHQLMDRGDLHGTGRHGRGGLDRPQGPLPRLDRRPAGRPGPLPARGRVLPRRLDRGSRSQRAPRPRRPWSTPTIGSPGDFPIHSVADIDALPFPPRMVNLKPSRIGSLRELCATYDLCAERGIGAYSGGQTELGVGRGQAQYLSAIFHPRRAQRPRPRGLQPARPAPRPPAQPAHRRVQRAGLSLEINCPSGASIAPLLG